MSNYMALGQAEAAVARKRAEMQGLFADVKRDGASEAAATAIKSGNDEMQQLVDKVMSIKAGIEGRKAVNRQILPENDDGLFSSSPRPMGDWGAAVLKANQEQGGMSGLKSLLPSGTAVVAVPVGGPIEDPRRARFLAELMPNEPAAGGHFAYLRQTSRIIAAAVVADEAEKPESQFDLTLIEGSTVTIAHLSQPTPRHYLEDSQRIVRFVESEMQLGLNLTIDQRIVSTVIGAGILQEGSLNDPLFATRRALTRLQEREVEPTAFVANPRDWEEIEREAALTYAANPGQTTPTDTMERRLWGVPVVVTNAIDEGTVLLGDFAGSAALYRAASEDGSIYPVRLDWSEAFNSGPNNATGFQTNTLQMRAECRLEVAVLRTFAFCEIATPLTGS